MDPKDVTVLLVDDDEVDRQAVIRAFHHLKIANRIVEARDGIEALEVLRGQRDAKRLQNPYLILLDLSMPRMDGIEFLREIRADSSLKMAVIFVLTTSNSDEDRVASYKENVAGYIVKSNFAHEFWRVVEMIDRYWRIIELP